MTPPPTNPHLMHVEISRYYSLKIEVTNWLKDGSCQRQPFTGQEYKFDKKSVGKNLLRGTHAAASQLRKMCSGYTTYWSYKKKKIQRFMLQLYVVRMMITLACDVFKVEYINADFKAVF